MKTKKCISILSVAMSGLLTGASLAIASPILDSDLASYTVLGASSERYIPKFTGESAGGRPDGIQAIAAINASPSGAALSNTNTTSQQGVGPTVMQLAQSLHLAGIDIPGWETPAHHVSIDDLATGTSNLPRLSTRDERDLARRYLCAIAQANMAVTAFNPELCNDISTPNNFQVVSSNTGNADNPYWGLPSTSTILAVSTRDTVELTGDLQSALLPAPLPVDFGANLDSAGSESAGRLIQLSSSDIETVFAAFPSALGIDEISAALPEPATLVLFALGLAGIGYSRKQTA